MNHKVNNVTDLHEQARTLLNNVVLGEADSIIDDLTTGIATLKNTWKGKDAGVQINNVIMVLNQMIAVRNSLAHLAIDASTVAYNYREIQNANGAQLGSLSILNCDDKIKMDEYTDNADTVSIVPEAESGKTSLEKANTAISSSFIGKVETSFNDIMSNWSQGGTTRSDAEEAFGNFKGNVSTYSQTLADVCTQIGTALSNYSSFN